MGQTTKQTLPLGLQKDLATGRKKDTLVQNLGERGFCSMETLLLLHRDHYVLFRKAGCCTSFVLLLPQVLTPGLCVLYVSQGIIAGVQCLAPRDVPSLL